MTDRRSRPPPDRLLDRVAQFLLSALIFVVTLPLWLAFALLLGVLVLARPFIVYPLGGAMLSGAGVGAYFAYTGAWADAAQAGLVAVIAGGLLAGYLALTDRFHSPDDLRQLFPPWWWTI